MKLIVVGLTLVLIICPDILATVQASPPLYHLTDLGSLGGPTIGGGATNSFGDVVGEWQISVPSSIATA